MGNNVAKTRVALLFRFSPCSTLEERGRLLGSALRSKSLPSAHWSDGAIWPNPDLRFMSGVPNRLTFVGCSLSLQRVGYARFRPIENARLAATARFINPVNRIKTGRGWCGERESKYE